ncbi:MAG: class I SAM-dependent methyltransferase [Acidobacteria bacterium]|nr:class I SAM-dependent methyltransferase [Acidobacteriota bacterium]
MSGWEKIWQETSARELWSVPDCLVLELATRWKQSASIHRVLDLGCGVGRHVLLLASMGFETYGLDHSEAALETCRARLQAAALTAQLHRGQMNDLPFADGYFDAVVAFNTIYHGTAREVDAMVELVRRKLRAGGEFFATLPSRDNRLYGKGEMIEPHTFCDPRMYKELLGGEGESGVPHHFSSREEVHQFYRRYSIQSLAHEELRLALPARRGTTVSWLPISKSYFWRVVARREDSHDG